MSAELLLAAVFWTAVSATAYAYALFPTVALALGRTRQTRRDEEQAPMPTLTLLIPAYNEEQNLEAKIRNVLASDYPASNLDTIVISDASTDRTNEIAARFERHGVRLLIQPERRGKTVGLNRAIALARGEIVVFTDANASYPPGALKRLSTYFHRSEVGLVTGYTRYRSPDENEGVGEVTNFYTTIERIIKRAESRWGCCVGADGAIFAMRRSLYRHLRADDINDFVLPLAVIEQGSECLFADDVFCIENPASDLEGEFRRQSRITNRTLRAIRRNIHLLNPLRHPVFAFFLFSHKLVRFLVPILLVSAAACLPFLVHTGTIYLAAAISTVGSLLLLMFLRATASLAEGTSTVGRPLRMLSAFLTMNAAFLNGWQRFVRGQRDVTWHHERTTA